MVEMKAPLIRSCIWPIFLCTYAVDAGEQPSHPPLLVSTGVENTSGMGKKEGSGRTVAVEDELKGGGKYQGEWMRPLTPLEVHRKAVQGLALVFVLSVCVCLYVFAHVLVEGWSCFWKNALKTSSLFFFPVLWCTAPRTPENLSVWSPLYVCWYSWLFLTVSVHLKGTPVLLPHKVEGNCKGWSKISWLFPSTWWVQKHWILQAHPTQL